MKIFFPQVEVKVQADTAYVIHNSVDRSELPYDLDSLLAQYPTDTLYGEEARQLSYAHFLDYVYPIWAVIALVAIAVIAVLVILFIRTQKRNERKSNEMMKEMVQLVQCNRINCDAVAELIDERVRMMQTIVSQYKEDESSGKNLKILDYVEHLQSLNARYRKIIESFKGDRSFLSQLEQSLNVGKSNIMTRIRAVYGDTIPDNDYLILAGLFAGMSTASISFITGVKEGTIRVKKSRFLDKFEKLEDSEDKQLFISELIKQ